MMGQRSSLTANCHCSGSQSLDLLGTSFQTSATDFIQMAAAMASALVNPGLGLGLDGCLTHAYTNTRFPFRSIGLVSFSFSLGSFVPDSNDVRSVGQSVRQCRDLGLTLTLTLTLISNLGLPGLAWSCLSFSSS